MKSPPQILIPLLVCLLAAPAARAAAQPASPTYSPPVRSIPLGSTFVDWDALAFRPSPVGLFCAIFDDPTPTLEKMEVHVTRLRPGMASHTPHHHPWEEILLIKEGQVEVSINGKKEGAGPGALIFLASNDAHNLNNVGGTLATYYVLNFYTSGVHTVRDQPAAEWAPSGTLASCVLDCDHLPGTPMKIGIHTGVTDSPTLTFPRFESHITTLNPGEGTTPRNRVPDDELFVVKSGTVEVTLKGATRTLGAGSLFYVAPNDERTMANAGKDPCSYQVFRIQSERTPGRG
jgi:quercetin dioxygenase-like cupin family protein